MDKPVPKQPFWTRLRALFAIEESPHVIAGSVAAAVLWGTSPFFVGVAGLPLTIWMFKLNKRISVGFTVLLLANPFMIFLMVIQTWLGLHLMGQPIPGWLLEFDYGELVKIMRQSTQLLVAYAVGGYSFAVVAGAATLAFLWPILHWKKKRKAQKGGNKDE